MRVINKNQKYFNDKCEIKRLDSVEIMQNKI